MDLEIVESDASQLAEYASVPSIYRIEQRLVRSSSTPDAIGSLTVEAVRSPYEKDYDAPPGIAPTAWSAHFDTRGWGIHLARRDGRTVGGAAIAPSRQVMPEAAWAEPTAMVWDLRVAREHRRERIGESLFRAAERWAMRNAFGAIAVETQDVNVAAARFYEAMGCRLVAFEPDAYVEVPGEARLIYQRTLIGDHAR